MVSELPAQLEGNSGTHILRTLRPQEEVPWTMDLVMYGTSTLLPHLAFVNQPKALVDSGSDQTVIITPKDICVQNEWKTGGGHSDVLWRNLSSLKRWGRG